MKQRDLLLLSDHLLESTETTSTVSRRLCTIDQITRYRFSGTRSLRHSLPLFFALNPISRSRHGQLHSSYEGDTLRPQTSRSRSVGKHFVRSHSLSFKPFIRKYVLTLSPLRRTCPVVQRRSVILIQKM